MPPRQSYQPPSQPQQPQRPAAPQAPHYGYGAADSQHFQQHPGGQYEAVPAPQPAQNGGHSGHNPYEFIVSPNAPKRAGLGLNLAGGSFFLRIGLLVGGAAIILVVAAVVISALAPKGSTPGLISIAERQQEIVRIATQATTQTVNQDAQNFVANVELSVGSSQQQVISYLSAHGTKLGTKTLALDQDSQTDTQLASAATANNYDSAVTQDLTGQLQTYETLLKTTHDQTGNAATKTLLQTDYSGAALLLKQASALSAELQQEGN